MSIQEKDLQSILWNDISVQKINNTDSVLVLVCTDTNNAERLYRLISSNHYSIKVKIAEDGNCIIEIDFEDTDLGIGMKSTRNETNYPPLKWLRHGQVTHITTGVFEGYGKYQNISPFLEISSTVNFN